MFGYRLIEGGYYDYLSLLNHNDNAAMWQHIYHRSSCPCPIPFRINRHNQYTYTNT